MGKNVSMMRQVEIFWVRVQHGAYNRLFGKNFRKARFFGKYKMLKPLSKGSRKTCCALLL